MSTGLSNQGKKRLHEVAQRHVGDEQVPGLVALVARGDDVHAEVLGTKAVGGPAMTRDSIFRISSDSKPITAAATLALAADGLLDLDEPVGRLLPELAGPRVLRRMDGPLDDTVPANRAITVRDLLTFTFGFGTAVEMFFAAEPWPVMAAEAALRLATLGPPDRDSQPDPDTWIAGLGSLPLLAQPGERWFYNTGASVLGVLAARAAGQPFARRAADPAVRAARHDQHRVLDHADRPSGDRLPGRPGRPRCLGPAGRIVEQAAGVPRRRGRPGLHRRRSAGVLPDAAARRRPGAPRRRGARDDHRPAHPGSRRPAAAWARTSSRTSRGASAWLCRMTGPTAGPAASAPPG